MNEQQQNIRDKKLFKYSSSKRYIKIHVPDFAFKHDDNNVGKDKFVGRELQIRKLFTWLTSDSKSGSYLITGYRGMGKSLLVKRVIDMISREPKAYKEVLFQFAMILTLIACFMGIADGKEGFTDNRINIAILGSISAFVVLILEISKYINHILFEYNVHKVPFHNILDKNMIAKFWLKNKDRRNKKYSNIAITVNLGQEVLDERDVLSLIAQSIRDKYYKFVHNRQNRPIANFIYIIGSGLFSFYLLKVFLIPLLGILGNCFSKDDSWISSITASLMCFFEGTTSFKSSNPEIYWVFLFIIYWVFYAGIVKLLKAIRKKIPYFSTPYNSLERLDNLCERVASSFNEEKGTHSQYSGNFFNFSFGKTGKSKSTPAATVRELELELMGIVNNINGEDCPNSYCAQFIIVFDELDKIANIRKKSNLEMEESAEETTPAFETTVRGFTDTMAYEDRKQSVLRLLANMKLFITSVKAKCIFISGYELFDASLADLSDREFAISSIFNGVLNVSSFLSPEREESDVSSMTEVYLATMLLPESYLKGRFQKCEPKSILSQVGYYLTKKVTDSITRIISFGPAPWPKSYLKQKVKENIIKNGILKDELPSLRWYNEYLMEVHILNDEHIFSKEEIQERELEIRHVMEFLRYFCVYLSQISNGSPKKIATYFEKYVRVNFDTIKQCDWYDEIQVGKPTENDVRKQCVLYFDPDAQKLVNFVHYITAPVMNAITNEVSHYGDKLLVSSSFILDQIYKYHGKGFSWRNLEQMPELLNTNKNPELRDSLASIMEFLLQTHITTISSSIFQYKFHKQIAEEISLLSKTSEEAAAIFNFTLNESETVKRYNTRLLWNYLNLNNQANDKNQKERYCGVLERLHENQGDIYFSEEDYYRAIHEYRSALQYIDDKNISAKNIIAYLKCSLKVGMSYEYRHTFENAYMVYCQIINKLIQLRWVDEKKLGLDYTMRLTKDWRIKQPILVDAKSLDEFSNGTNRKYRKHIKSGLLEDVEKEEWFKPEYSTDSDKMISSLANNFTPQKSDIFLRLTAFEDIKFIYQSILAKLFVIEKMESSGITQSSIDAAEAEFKTLYNITNHKEKYILAADFFCKFASILYYKNAIVSPDRDESIYTTLYLFDIDLLALIDDYCFSKSTSPDTHDAFKIKKTITDYLTTAKTSKIIKTTKNGSTPNNLTCLICGNEFVLQYLFYLDNKGIFNVSQKWNRLKDCFNRRSVLTANGCKLPCSACKYANRSLIILLKNLFDHNDNEGESKVITLLRYSSHKKQQKSRPEILSQLASSSEQLADILLSCACTSEKKESDIQDNIGVETIELLCALTVPENLDDNDKEKAIELFLERINATNKTSHKDSIREDDNRNKFSKLDRVLLYYWAACRYYDIASMHHEAVHCIWRIVNVIENYLTVHSYNDIEVPNYIKEASENKLDKLLKQLFIQASRIVSRQYDNFDTVEIHELKWLLHFEHFDDVDLTKLTLFPNLQSIFITIINCKLLIYQLNKSEFEIINNGKNENKEDYISRIYLWLTRNWHNRTFKSDVELNYLKAKINLLIFDNILGGIIGTRQKILNLQNELPAIHKKYYQNLTQFLDKEKTFFEERLFGISDDTQSRLDLLDFLIQDSVTCLFNIIDVLPPHNQFSSFSNNFIGNVYCDLWMWSKYYELMYNAYIYYRYYLDGNTTVVNSLNKYGNANNFKSLAEKLKKKNVVCKDNYGYRYSKLNQNLRHDVDDATIHHIYINYSAEMAIKYFRAARGINSEGLEYKNLINNMYLLDDDLRNDTCQSNLADERYLINCGIINKFRLAMQRLYQYSRTNRLDSFENSEEVQKGNPYLHLRDRFTDSLYTNTEY